MDVIKPTIPVFEIVILLGFFLCGIGGLISPSAVTTASLSDVGIYSTITLYACLALGSLTALVGAARPNTTGLFVERAGLFLLSPVLAGFAGVVLIEGTPRSFFFFVFVASFSSACLLRAWQIRNELRRIDAAITTMVETV